MLKRKHVVTALIGLLIALAVTAIQGGFAAGSSTRVAQAMCDGCFVAGALLVCVGLLVFVANDGFFDLMNYGVQKMLHFLISKEHREGFPRTYLEYHELKTGTRKGSMAYILIIGLCWILLAALCLVLEPGLLN